MREDVSSAEQGLRSRALQDDDRRNGDRRNGAQPFEEPDNDNILLTFFVPDLSVGGAEQVTVSIVNGLVARGYDIELLLSRNEGELRSRLSTQVTVSTLPPSRTWTFGVAAHLPALVRYLRRTNPDAIVPHLTQTSVVCLAAKQMLNADTLVIPTHHSAFGASTNKTVKDRVLERLVVRLYPTADRIIAVSEGVADSITQRIRVERGDISVLHNPVDIESVLEMSERPVDDEWVEDDETSVILFVGRLAEQKDLETWLRAFRSIHDRKPDTRGLIVGKGPQRDRLERLAASLGIADVVSLPGYVENPYRYMRQAETFLLSSRYEGLPTVLIEALACGCPIVATDCVSGPREILADGEFGRLAPTEDHAELAAAVMETLADPIPPAKLRERAADFAPEAVFDEYERFIRAYVSST